MPKKSDLQHLEIECASVDDWTDLAMQALQDPVDFDYADELAGKAKMDCRNPEDYANLARFVAEYFLTDSDYLEELLDQTKNVCFEPMEYAELGYACTMLGNSDRGLAIIYKVVADIDVNEYGFGYDLFKLAKYAGETGTGDLAEAMSEEDGCFGDLNAWGILSLAKWVSPYNIKAAKSMSKTAACDLHSLADHVSFAKVIIQFDQSHARRLLEDAVLYCEAVEDYIELAQGVSEVLDEPDRVDDLLLKAAQIASDGGDFAILAYAWLELKDNRGAAFAIFRQAVPDIFSPTVLRNITITAMREFNDLELALQCYLRTADIVANPDELVKFVVSCWEILERHQSGHYYMRDFFNAIKAKTVNTLDLVVLAASVVQTLNDREMVCAIYRDAILACDRFSELEHILISQRASLNDAKLTFEAINRMKLLASNSAQLVATFTVARSSSQDSEMFRSILVDAENAATSFADLESIVVAVREFCPDDQTWISTLQDKLENLRRN